MSVMQNSLAFLNIKCKSCKEKEMTVSSFGTHQILSGLGAPFPLCVRNTCRSTAISTCSTTLPLVLRLMHLQVLEYAKKGNKTLVWS